MKDDWMFGESRVTVVFWEKKSARSAAARQSSSSSSQLLASCTEARAGFKVWGLGGVGLNPEP